MPVIVTTDPVTRNVYVTVSRQRGPAGADGTGGGGGGATAFTDLTDKVTADIPAINTPTGDAITAAKDRANHTGTQAQSTIVNLTTDLAAKAPLASPALTGTPSAPTASVSTNTTQLATTAFVQAAIDALVNASPSQLDTLNELAAALGNDANFATTMTAALAGKASLASGATFTGPVTFTDSVDFTSTVVTFDVGGRADFQSALNLVPGTDVVEVNGPLHTPSSGALTNCTGLPVAGLAQSGATTGQVPTWNGSVWAPATSGDTPIYGFLTSDYTLTSTTSFQKLFDFSINGAVTLATGRYRFSLTIRVSNMSGTSGNAQISLLGTGTATIANVIAQSVGIDNNSAISSNARSGAATANETFSNQILTAGTGTQMFAEISGFFNITASGTIIPSIALATAAAADVKADSGILINYLGPTGSNTQGTWS